MRVADKKSMKLVRKVIFFLPLLFLKEIIIINRLHFKNPIIFAYLWKIQATLTFCLTSITMIICI